MKPIRAEFDVEHEGGRYRITFNLSGELAGYVKVSTDRTGVWDVRYARNTIDRGREYKPCLSHCSRLIDLWDQLLLTPEAAS